MSRPRDRRILAELVVRESHTEVRDALISVRPLNMAFVYNRSLGIEGLRKIVRFNSSAWNGINSVIVPSDGSQIKDYWVHWLIGFDPDVVIQVGDFNSETMQELTDRIQPFWTRVWNDALLEPQGWINRNPGAIYIGYYYTYLYEKYHPLSSSESNIRIPVCKPEDPNRLFIEAQFGILPDQLSGFLEEKMQGTPIRFRPNDFANYLGRLVELKNRMYPLSITHHSINHVVYGGNSGSILVIASPSSVDDLCLYWNLRSGPGTFEKEVYVVPYEPLQHDQEIQVLAEWCNQVITQSNTIQLHSCSVSKDRLLALKGRLKPQLNGQLSRVDIRYSNFQIERFHSYVEERQQQVQINDGMATFTPPRISWLDNPERMPFAVDLSFGKIVDKTKRFLPPKYPGRNRSLCENSRYSMFGGYVEPFRITGDRLSCLEDQYHDIKRVFLPNDEEIFQQLLRHYGLKSNISEKCRYVRRIVDLFGGLRETHSLKSEDWRNVFDKMRMDPLDVNHMMQTYRPGGDKSGFLKQVAKFARKGIFLRGYEIRCPSCGYAHWYAIEEIHEVIKCVGCRASIQPPIECPFSYKLNDLVLRGVEQGLFSVLLTMLYLHEICEVGIHCLPGIEVGPNKQDIDILSACDGYLVAAECKTLADCDTALPDEVKGQIEKTAELSDRIGVSVLFFALLRAEPPSDLQLLVADLNRRYGGNMSVHVIDSTHLEYTRKHRDAEAQKEHKLTQYLPNADSIRDGGQVRDEGSFRVWM